MSEEAAIDKLTAATAAHPDKPAVIDDRPDGFLRIVTFRELNELVNRIGNGLIRAGFEPGERLVWAGRSSLEAIAVQHAVRKVGGYSIALNHALKRDEVHSITRVAEAALVFAEGAFREIFSGELPEGVRKVVIFGGETLPGQLSLEACIEGCSDEEPSTKRASKRAFDAMLNFTSGTTGQPKGVIRRGLSEEEARMQARMLGDGEGIFMVTGSLSHSGPGGYANNCLNMGNTVILQRKFDAEDWLRLVAKYGATTTYSAPYMMRQVCNLPAEVRERYDVSGLRTMIAAAAQWSYELKQAFVAAFPDAELWELYGSTELGSVTVMEPADQLRKPGSCGHAAAGVEIMLVAEDGSEIKDPDTPGLLYAKSGSVCDDYVGAHETYEEVCRGEFMTVGDIAYFDEEGFYYICDRQKDMVISAGVNIYPREIENLVERHPSVFECAVIGIPDDEWGEKLHAIVVLREAATLAPADFESFCREHLAGHKVPRSVEFCETLPHLLSGKVDKKALRRDAGAAR